MATRYIFRDSTGTQPRLAFAQSYWALQERGQPIQEQLEQACRGGFEYLEAGLREDRMPDLRGILNALPLKFIAQGWATTADECVPFFERAVELNAVAMNLHLGHAYLDDAETARLVDAAYAFAETYGLPLMMETHRGRLTQDLFRTQTLMRRRPSTCIALDVSHYLVAGETQGGDVTAFDAALSPLLDATELIHGRISNGQQIQTVTADAVPAALTQAIWQRAMATWLRDAPADAVLIFEPELGPPPYAFVVDGRETSCRNTETEALVQIARDAWDAAVQRGAA